MGGPLTKVNSCIRHFETVVVPLAATNSKCCPNIGSNNKVLDQLWKSGIPWKAWFISFSEGRVPICKMEFRNNQLIDYCISKRSAEWKCIPCFSDLSIFIFLKSRKNILFRLFFPSPLGLHLCFSRTNISGIDPSHTLLFTYARSFTVGYILTSV